MMDITAILFIAAIAGIVPVDVFFVNRKINRESKEAIKLSELKYKKVNFKIGEEVLCKVTGKTLIISSIGIWGVVEAYPKPAKGFEYLYRLAWHYPHTELIKIDAN